MGTADVSEKEKVQAVQDHGGSGRVQRTRAPRFMGATRGLKGRCGDRRPDTFEKIVINWCSIWEIYNIIHIAKYVTSRRESKSFKMRYFTLFSEIFSGLGPEPPAKRFSSKNYFILFGQSTRILPGSVILLYLKKLFKKRGRHEFCIRALIWHWPVLFMALVKAFHARTFEASKNSFIPLRLVSSGEWQFLELHMPCLSVWVALYSVRGLERSELGGSHGCPGRLWDRFLWQVYTPSKASCLLSFW